VPEQQTIDVTKWDDDKLGEVLTHLEMLQHDPGFKFFMQWNGTAASSWMSSIPEMVDETRLRMYQGRVQAYDVLFASWDTCREQLQEEIQRREEARKPATAVQRHLDTETGM
jgi:hypothetical protein